MMSLNNQPSMQCLLKKYFNWTSKYQSCNRIFHLKCSKKKNFKTFRNKLFCPSCMKIHDIIRYNPFYDLLEEQNENFFENEPVEYIDSIQELSEILENCKDYSKIEFNDT